MEPMEIVVVVASASALFSWVASLVTGDTSWVDRFWSIVPVAYVWVFAGAAHLADARLDVMAGVVTLWGARLTFNFARRGGYRGVEDYRWAVLRASMSRLVFALFNFFFIAVYQNVLLVLITLPALSAYQHRGRGGYGGWDLLLAVLFVAATVGETVADQQQWTFQEGKRRRRERGLAPTENFVQTGLFAYSRHPNYFFELAQWWLFLVMGTVAAGTLDAWSLAGPVLLSALFIGSTRFTERISRSRYPEYALYQRRVPAIVPRPRRAVAPVLAGD
jgi:steroid 5-alpha reductase family enzyme